MNTRKLSNTQEKRLAKNIGGRQVIGSGSTPFLKGDVITSDLFIEAKTKAVESKSISVKKAWLEKAQEQAYSMRKKDYAFGAEDRVQVKFSTFYELVKGCTQRDQMLNAINCNVPHRYIREMVTGKSEEPEKRELLIGAPKEEKQGGKKR